MFILQKEKTQQIWRENFAEPVIHPIAQTFADDEELKIEFSKNLKNLLDILNMKPVPEYKS